MTVTVRLLRSIRGRITLVSTALVAITMMLASLVLIQLVRQDLLASTQATIDQALEAQAEEIEQPPGPIDDSNAIAMEAIDVDDGVDVDDSHGVVFEVDPSDPAGIAFGQVYVDNTVPVVIGLIPETGQVVEMYDPVLEEPIEDLAIREQLDSMIFETHALSDPEGTQFLVGAAPLAEIEESVAAVQAALMVIVPSLTLILGLSVWLLVGRALRPVMSITNRVEAISSANLDQRIPVPETGDEVADLAAVMNGMLERLERGGERQRQFSADASHELRSPLSTVRTAAEMLRRKPETARVECLAEDIVAESDRMNLLIGNLLELSRLDENRTSSIEEELELAQVLRHELREELADGLVQFQAPQELAMSGSPTQLRRLIRNLVDNAMRHANDQVSVTLETATLARGWSSIEQEQPATAIVLSVEDDGTGIPVRSRDRIFERFARLDHARDRDSGGTGLGLSLVKAIVEYHDGEIVVDDSPMGGARFAVTMYPHRRSTPTDEPIPCSGSGARKR